VKNTHNDTRCINNLQKNIYSGLIIYQQRYGRYPDVSGDLFLASLYYTRIVSFEDAGDFFICPEDAANDGAMFTEAIANKIGLAPRREDDPDPKDDWDEDTVPPTGISYAARYNWNIENGPHPEEEWYDVGQDPTDESVPLVCDDDEDRNGKLSDEDFEFTHGDHYNVLWSGGLVKPLTEKVRVGQKGTILEALRN
ncbi:MAG: hypothetical protein ABIH04_04365, partial [Planctomycetota bacterium]